MNANEQFYGVMDYQSTLGSTRQGLEYILGYAKQYNSYDTLQFADYSKMNANMFDPEEKIGQHETQFPIDEKECFEMGRRLVEKAREMNCNR